MMRKHAILSVHISVLLFGLAGLFAKWIHLPAICITFGRVLFSSAALGLFLLVSRQRIRVTGRDWRMLVLAGAILALHWWSFLQAIQISTVAIGTVTFSAFPLFVTFLEPIVFHQRLKTRNVVIAAVLLLGVLIMIPDFSLENQRFLGIGVGMLSALSYAVLTILNKRLVESVSGTVTAFYEQTAAAVLLLPFACAAKAQPAGSDIALLLVLGVVMTALAHTLFIKSLKTIPAQMAGICSALETVYSILFAFLLLGERPAVREILGAALIVGTVLAAQLRGEQTD